MEIRGLEQFRDGYRYGRQFRGRTYTAGLPSDFKDAVQRAIYFNMELGRDLPASPHAFYVALKREAAFWPDTG
jgi:hypothetical protein